MMWSKTAEKLKVIVYHDEAHGVWYTVRLRTSCEFHCQDSYISPMTMIRKAMLSSKSINKHSSEHSYFLYEKNKRRNVRGLEL